MPDADPVDIGDRVQGTRPQNARRNPDIACARTRLARLRRLSACFIYRHADKDLARETDH